jgi:hypothetical protein
MDGSASPGFFPFAIFSFRSLTVHGSFPIMFEEAKEEKQHFPATGVKLQSYRVARKAGCVGSLGSELINFAAVGKQS